MSEELTTPVGRLVGGHPMVPRAVIDDTTKLPKLQKDGVSPLMDTYIGLAIPKGAETHWNQTEWGAVIYQVAVAAWPAGEYNAPTFAWKIVDGDSAVPNKNGNVPNTREGYPGHWIINASTMLAVNAFHVGKYKPIEQIQDKNTIKPGDYARLRLEIKGNNPSQSPGVYLNPTLFELSRAGQQIVLASGADAGEAFGTAPVVPANALVDTGVVPVPPVAGAVVPVPPVAGAVVPVPPVAGAVVPVPPVVTPAQDFLNPVAAGAVVPPAPPVATPAPPVEASYNVSGTIYTASALRTAGYTDAQLAALPVVAADDIPF